MSDATGTGNGRSGPGAARRFVHLSADEEGVATIRLERPPVNALNPTVWHELHDVATTLAREPEVRAVVLWGGEKVFAAGADIKAMADESFQSFSAVAVGLQEALRALANLPQIVIAAVTGYALGGGCELALTADFRFAARDARLGQPEMLLGIIPGAGGTQRLPRLVGVQRAKDLIYSGRMVDAQEALQIGLVDAVFDPGEVYGRAVEQARRYAAGPYALRLAKQAIDLGAELDLDSALRLETSLFTACFATRDREVGMRSFLEQGPGKAQFTGS
ncbi:MAG TPA: enoyl-CoA hydratase-related protein [Euzebyales bacterium]|nr:enoyl-CoA hydratase-related protein [Euzebyales bacterium]